eukprot:g2810.t1
MHPGWPKFAMAAFVIEPAAAADGSTTAASDAVVVASLVPASATLPASVGGGGTITTDSKYPFGDDATVKVSGNSAPVSVKVRIPGWATKATVNGKAAANGTLAAVVCPPSPSASAAAGAAAACEISIALNPEITVEKGWGSFGTKAGAPVAYAAEGASVPSAAALGDWEFGGAAATMQGKPTPCGKGVPATPHCNYTTAAGALTAGHDCPGSPAQMTTAQAQAACDADTTCLAYTFSAPETPGDPHACDTKPCQTYLKSVTAHNTDPVWQTFFKGGNTVISTGTPGGVSSATVIHPIAGEGHYLTKLSMAFKYVAGYTPSPGKPKNASTISINVLDAATGKPATADGKPVYTSAPLGNYSLDRFTGYSPLQTVVVDGLKIPNSKPLLLQLVFDNNQRNLQLRLDASAGFDFKVYWSTDKGPDPPSPPSPYLTPPCNGAAITRGPLVFALHPTENKTVVKDYSDDLPARPKAVDYEIGTNDTWNYALVLPGSGGDDAGGAAALTFDPTPSANWLESFPFDDSGEYPFSIKAQARQLAAWGYWEGSKITAVPPASPVKCSGSGDCGDATELRLVPFGGTNIRVAVFPWMSGPAQEGSL